MGSSSPKSTTTTTTNNLDPNVARWTQNNYNYAQNVANQQYSPYTGQMVAPLNSLQMAGIAQGSQFAQSNLGMSAINQGITNAIQAGNYSPLQVTAPSSVAQVSAPSGTLQVTAPSSVAQVSAPGAYNPMQVNTGTWDSAAAQQYMSPYTQSVIDAANANIDRNLAQTQANTNAAATTAGAYGGTRQAVANAENARNADMLKAQIAAGLLSDAYNNAQSAFQADQGRSLAAQQSNQQAGLSAGLTAQQQALQAALANQQAALANQQMGLTAQQSNQQASLANQQMGLQASLANQQAALANQQMGLTAQQSNQQAGLNAANLGLGSADLLGRLGIVQQGVAQNNANALLGYGSVLQDQQNAENQWNYQNNYLNPQNWPLRGLSALESAVSGIPYATSSSTTAPLYKNQMASALGGAATGAAIGSVIPGVGTAIGAGVGAGVGGLLGYFS